MFHCFKCGRSGNALDLWAQATRQTIYDATIDLCQKLNIPLTIKPSRNKEEEPVATNAHTTSMSLLEA
jgi:DNA primase